MRWVEGGVAAPGWAVFLLGEGIALFELDEMVGRGSSKVRAHIRTEVVGGATVEHDVDLLAAVPCGENVLVPESLMGTRWWSMDEINGAGLMVMR